MTTILATCDECGEVRMTPDCMLINTIPGAAWYAWNCSCGEYRTVFCTRESVDLLVDGGVRLIVAQYPDELDEARVGPAISREDVGRFIALAEWNADIADIASREGAS